jgi:hypothetical protein
VRLDKSGIASQVKHTLSEHMLCHRDRRRPGHHPVEVFLEGAGEHAEVDRRTRPIRRSDQLGVAAVFTTREERNAIADLLAVEECPQFLCADAHFAPVL